MFRVMWKFPFYASSLATAPSFTYAEAWSFPVRSAPASSSNSLVHGVPELVEAGHKQG